MRGGCPATTSLRCRRSGERGGGSERLVEQCEGLHQRRGERPVLDDCRPRRQGRRPPRADAMPPPEGVQAAGVGDPREHLVLPAVIPGKAVAHLVAADRRLEVKPPQARVGEMRTEQPLPPAAIRHGRHRFPGPSAAGMQTTSWMRDSWAEKAPCPSVTHRDCMSTPGTDRHGGRCSAGRDRSERVHGGG